MRKGSMDKGKVEVRKMERKTLSNGIPGLTMPGAIDLASNASAADGLRKTLPMDDFSRNGQSRFNSTLGYVGAIEDMPARIVSARESDPKVFISHSSIDKKYAQALVKLFETIGLDNKKVFCSSVPGYGIPLGKDIFETLSEEFNQHALQIIYLLSENYYKSEASLNEMGAAWVLGKKYTSILVPGFDFSEIKGAIDPRKISIKIDSDEDEYLQRIDELKNQLTKDFSLTPISNAQWGKARIHFRMDCLDIAKGMKADKEAHLK